MQNNIIDKKIAYNNDQYKDIEKYNNENKIKLNASRYVMKCARY